MAFKRNQGRIVTISPVRCAVLALLGREPKVPSESLARWVGSAAYGRLEVMLLDGQAATSVGRYVTGRA